MSASVERSQSIPSSSFPRRNSSTPTGLTTRTASLTVVLLLRKSLSSSRLHHPPKFDFTYSAGDLWRECVGLGVSGKLKLFSWSPVRISVHTKFKTSHSQEIELHRIHQRCQGRHRSWQHFPPRLRRALAFSLVSKARAKGACWWSPPQGCTHGTGHMGSVPGLVSRAFWSRVWKIHA